MATNAAYRNFLQDNVIGLNAETAREVVDVHGIDTMKKLADLTRQDVAELAQVIRKQKVAMVAPLPDRYMNFPASSVRYVYLAAVIARNMERVSRNVVPADLLTIMQDRDLLEMHEQQIDIEKNQDNTLGETYFAPLTDKIVNDKGFKTWDENARRALEEIRGEASGTPLAYLVRRNIHPLPEAQQPGSDFDTLDEQLIARKPIIKHGRRNESDEDCEAAGSAWKRPEVNADNRKLHALIVKAVESTSMLVHIEPTMNTKDGRKAYFLLRSNLMTDHEVELKARDNMNKLRSLSWAKDTNNWTFGRYRAAHKLCHNMQGKLCREHGYQDIPERDKVNIFLEGTRNPDSNSAIIAITR